ncbi:MAG: hypothetical protein ACK5HL_02785 [Bacilli bacterium]
MIWRKEIYDGKELENFRTFINDFVAKDLEIFDIFIKLLIKTSFIKNHPLNSDFLHNWLFNKKLGERDYIWTITINNLYLYDNEIFDMLYEYCMTQGNKNLDDETILLFSQLLGWFFTSSNRKMRDKFTKCLVSILENKIHLMTNLIDIFLEVDDMYVLERILAGCYGEILRSDILEPSNVFSDYIYNSFFKDKVLNPNILIRHYCKSIIEFATRNFTMNFDINEIYNHKKNEWYKQKEIPTSEEIKEKYVYDYRDEKIKRYYFSSNTIVSSMTTEHSDLGMYGDFGRYIFERLVDQWKHHFRKQQILANIVIKRVFDMGYDVEMHGIYDSTTHNYDKYSHNPERIGKKYQWLATYELIGKLCDNFSMIEYVYSDTPIDLEKNKYLDRHYNETKSLNKINYVIVNKYDMNDSSIINIDPSLFITVQERKAIKIESSNSD